MMPTRARELGVGGVEGIGRARIRKLGAFRYRSVVRSVVLRSVFLTLPLVGAAYAAGCGSDEAGTAPADAGVDVKEEPVVDAAVPIDAADAADAGLDCTTDLAKDGLQGHLSCTGLYSDFAAKTVAADNKPYTPGVEFWSDAAVKSRWLYLPPGAKIDIADFDAWKFPVGTRVWKEFIVDGKRTETRLYQKIATGFIHATYRWNADDSEALRKDDGEQIPRDGGSPYEIPSTFECETCHAGGSDSLLGVEAISLGMPTAKGLTLAALAADNRFSATPPTTTITVPDGQNATARPALGWLHANCSSCHQKNGSSMTTLQLRLTWAQLASGTATVESLDTYTTAVNKPSSQMDGAGGFTALIAGGSPTKSRVSQRSGTRVPDDLPPAAGDQMPPLVSRRVDTVGHGLLDDWITQLPP